MKHTHVPKLFIGLTILFAALLIIGDRNVANGQTSTAVNERYLSGFAWSSNIGWISMRGSNYGVELSTAGNLRGYAWSSNLGWVSFNAADVSSCPSGNGPCTPMVDLQSGAVSGWARACSGTKTKDCKGTDRTDGWEGWIHLSGVKHNSPEADGQGGVTYLPSSSRFKGYAWGSDVVGWINFDGVNVIDDGVVSDPDEYGPVDIPPVISLFRMNPSLVSRKQACTMIWEVENADNCIIEGEGYTPEYEVSLPYGSDRTAPIVSAKIYKLSCSNAAGTVTKSAACRLNPSAMEQ